MIASGDWMVIRNHDHNQENLTENLSIFVITVPADGQAQLGARTSAGTVMIKFDSMQIQDWQW